MRVFYQHESCVPAAPKLAGLAEYMGLLLRAMQHDLRDNSEELRGLSGWCLLTARPCPRCGSRHRGVDEQRGLRARPDVACTAIETSCSRCFSLAAVAGFLAICPRRGALRRRPLHSGKSPKDPHNKPEADSAGEVKWIWAAVNW